MYDYVEHEYYKRNGGIHLRYKHQHESIRGSIVYKTPCGITVVNADVPEWRPETKRLFLRGRGHRDTRPTRVESLKDIIAINTAIAQFNRYWKTMI